MWQIARILKIRAGDASGRILTPKCSWSINRTSERKPAAPQSLTMPHRNPTSRVPRSILPKAQIAWQNCTIAYPSDHLNFCLIGFLNIFDYLFNLFCILSVAPDMLPLRHCVDVRICMQWLSQCGILAEANPTYESSVGTSSGRLSIWRSALLIYHPTLK